jgi:hypothetical protein
MNERKSVVTIIYTYTEPVLVERQARIRANTGAGLVSFREYYTLCTEAEFMNVQFR